MWIKKMHIQCPVEHRTLGDGFVNGANVGAISIVQRTVVQMLSQDHPTGEKVYTPDPLIPRYLPSQDPRWVPLNPHCHR